MRHLGKAHAQLLSHRAPGSTRIPHALSRMNSASAAKPSHCILHCARRCRLLGASVGAISSLCDAAVSDAHRARLLCARRGYLVASLVSASAAQLLWSTSGPKGPRRRFRRRVPVNPGRRAGDSACETAAGRAGRRATGDLPPRLPPEAWFGRSPQAPFRPRASPQAPLTPVHELRRCPELPLEPPTPAWAQGFASEPIADFPKTKIQFAKALDKGSAPALSTVVPNCMSSTAISRAVCQGVVFQMNARARGRVVLWKVNARSQSE